MVGGSRKEELDALRVEVNGFLNSVERYNSNNLPKFERYVQLQVSENSYDLEANLAILKLYQFFPNLYKPEVVSWILLKALTNLPHTDFVLCRCLLGPGQLEDMHILRIAYLANLLELCQFKKFWQEKSQDANLISQISGFDDSVRKFICHVVNITYQTVDKTALKELLGGITDADLRSWIAKNSWKEEPNNMVFISNQEEHVKTKNITEKITFDTVSVVM
uniref:Eukaryotic translation initiation factor 3 subunit K n=1 Tax=Isotomurus palustris TaxID=36144 RepID=A0A481SWZ0_9HEXA|nr:eukaryotic translation initiation factor 3 subunit K [Isotomurus palustris]